MGSRARNTISFIGAVLAYVVTNALTGGRWWGVLSAAIVGGVLGAIIPSKGENEDNQFGE